MSGCTAEEPISFLDDDDVDLAAYDNLNSAAYARDEVDVQAYGNSVINPTPASVTNRVPGGGTGSDDDFPFRDFDDEGLEFADRVPEFMAPPKEFEVPDLTLDCGEIRPGDLVELEDHTGRKADHMISGDFLLVRSIVENMQDGEVVLRGYRMRRCAYLQPTFDGK
jgi:DNA (cytosine-5)-methyltransferase 1